ncbi:MAG: VWA domain-containing protein, partial [Planctomycetes bacterium]|nr:VWA domain-containing protein [Planctomycetota bacterium]
MIRTENISAFVTSVLIHALLLTALGMIRYSLVSEQPEMILETTFDEEELPIQEEFFQELDTNTEIADTANLVAGGEVSTEMASLKEPAVEEEKLASADTLAEPDLRVSLTEVALPGDSLLIEDLGAEEVAGETGAVVEGYGPALSRLTQELLRLMRKDKLLVAWLFDESFSMKADQKAISEQFNKVYEELRIQQQRDKSLRKGDDILETVILGFGESLHTLTKQPTSSLREIRAAIDRIGIDDTGQENMCRAVVSVVDKYSVMAGRRKRRLVIIIVTDESPSDESYLENAITRAKQTRTPIYVLGREAMFGYPYAFFHWKDPKYGLDHHVRINRGPETAYSECLQYNGTWERTRSFPSGFGPYSQMRLARETGGIFFILPTREKLVGYERGAPPKFDPIAMKEYQPQLLARKVYAERRRRSKFRSTIWSVIVTLNPHQDEQLKLLTYYFPIDPVGFRDKAEPQFEKALRVQGLLTEAIKLLDSIRPLRDQEPLRRWRANYDLIRAQCIAYRIVVFQYLLALDRHANQFPKPQDKKSNIWYLARTKQLLLPDEKQFERLRRFFHIRQIREEYLESLKEATKRADEAYRFVENEHPGTPWAVRAAQERNAGYGFTMKEG